MIVGVDTFRSHLDLITWADFTAWNGGTPVAFGGRGFLGGKFLWGHGEATNALAQPHPDHPEQLAVVVPKIAPIQQRLSSRQQIAGAVGFLYGQTDAQAICVRLAQSIIAGELSIGPRRFATVWLDVDPTVDLTADYWAGWSSFVNSYPPPINFVGENAPPQQPFMAGVLCRYVLDGGKLHRDPHVTAALAGAVNRGLNTNAYEFWADVPNPDPSGVPPNPVLDWTQFNAADTPAIWRFSTGMRDQHNNPVNAPFDLDVVRERLAPDVGPIATDHMFVANAWQTTRTVTAIGYSNNSPTTADQLNNCVLQTNLPNMNDSAGIPMHGGPVGMVGRYIKVGGNVGASITRAEAESLSNVGVPVFTTWENFNVIANGEPVWNDPDHPQWFHIGIQYFRPAAHAGVEDSVAAFAFAGRTLKQPPHTPIFFAVDGDPVWDNVIDAAAHHTQGDWIVGYFQAVFTQRQAWNAANPGRPYLIGVYAGGRVLRELYKLGIVDMYWQAMSPGFDESLPAQHWWPWPHLNRWQYQGDQHFNCQHGVVMIGIDPDADWGDGGTWVLTDPFERQLEQQEAAAQHLIQLFNDLLQ